MYSKALRIFLYAKIYLFIFFHKMFHFGKKKEVIRLHPL